MSYEKTVETAQSSVGSESVSRASKAGRTGRTSGSSGGDGEEEEDKQEGCAAFLQQDLGSSSCGKAGADLGGRQAFGVVWVRRIRLQHDRAQSHGCSHAERNAVQYNTIREARWRREALKRP